MSVLGTDCANTNRLGWKQVWVAENCEAQPAVFLSRRFEVVRVPRRDGAKRQPE